MLKDDFDAFATLILRRCSCWLSSPIFELDFGRARSGGSSLWQNVTSLLLAGLICLLASLCRLSAVGCREQGVLCSSLTI